MLEKVSVASRVTVEKSSTDLVRACRGWIEAVAGQQSGEDTRESWLARAAKRSGLTYRTIKSLYYGQIEDPHHPAVDQLKSAAQRYAISSLIDRVERIAAELRQLARGAIL